MQQRKGPKTKNESYKLPFWKSTITQNDISMKMFVQKKISSSISEFSFFEYIGALTCGTVILNYYLNKPLMNIGVFSIYYLFGLFFLILKFYTNYKRHKS